MASFFRPHYHTAPQPNFQGLFRLIDDFDKYSSEGPSHSRQGRSSCVSSFTPKFDMRESETAYELYGELPGIAKEDIHIEFTEPQTLQVRGRIERTHTAGTPPAGLVDGKADEMSGAITDSGEDAVLVDHAETASVKSHQATVEDDPEETSAAGSTASTPQDTPATTVAETVKADEPKQQRRSEALKHKYYLVERNIGQFSRSFAFPSRVDNDSVQASLDNGILTIVVQKAKKHQSRRIAIN
ncbi:hypothetical protein JX265_007839 [Neoarthrinium moseri]|uniref:SHSP domain-containing protein n=1 Tax=Neoarthrinium moseri TaxID=1658444 RepID=A0A9P9WJF6_9PEZI|nr:hypothetical protein JX265_007839 [Neoarthrinium moseri]